MEAESLRNRILPGVEKLMKAGGQIMLEAKDIDSAVDAKSGRQNFVTEYDRKVQEYLQAGLEELFPEALFMGEESSSDTDISSGYAWIVDPIDGTTNFIKGLNMSCISVALSHDGFPVLGAVYNPYFDEFFSAVKGLGATLNGKKIRVSEHELKDGVVSIGTAPYYPELVDRSFETAKYYFDRCIDIRRCGSAALDLCSVACGRVELYTELRVYPWDFAAGALIVQEAGGIVTDAEGRELSCLSYTSIKAGNAVVMKQETI